MEGLKCRVWVYELKSVEMSVKKISSLTHADAHLCECVCVLCKLGQTRQRPELRTTTAVCLNVCVCVCLFEGTTEERWRKREQGLGRRDRMLGVWIVRR